MGGWRRIRAWAASMKRNTLALWIAARDPRTPAAAKLVAAVVAAYALSPIDLIPDFIPVLGLLDELLLLPAGIAVALRLIPTVLMEEFRAAAAQRIARPSSIVAGTIIAVLWMAAAALGTAWLLDRLD
ncbi:DUF1232 domain-containing protein [Sphingomonas lenta]|nr:DUF1232 domain-containing protein [Sphingomonas lenta]